MIQRQQIGPAWALKTIERKAPWLRVEDIGQSRYRVYWKETEPYKNEMLHDMCSKHGSVSSSRLVELAKDLAKIV